MEGKKGEKEKFRRIEIKKWKRREDEKKRVEKKVYKRRETMKITTPGSGKKKKNHFYIKLKMKMAWNSGSRSKLEIIETSPYFLEWKILYLLRLN